MNKMTMTKKGVLSLVCAFAMVMTSGASAAQQSAASTSLWKAGSTANKIIVISDLHLGVSDDISETVKNRTYLVEFLKRIQLTKDIKELVIAGDFLDDWYLPLSYPAYSDPQGFYTAVIKNNQSVIDELNKIMAKGIKVIYVPGNHDMLLKAETVMKAMPKLTFVGKSGIGEYITGDRKEIVIEHSNRYDIFSSPDTITNAALTNGKSILPPGYFYARVAASWVLQGKPPIKKDIPEITTIPNRKDVDQYDAYMYYGIWKGTFSRFTNIERFEDKVFDLKIDGFNGKYSTQDLLPIIQEDGTISAPTLYKNFQRTWPERQSVNKVNVTIPFIESATAAIKGDSTEYFPKQLAIQYANKNIEIAIFGHTHYPLVKKVNNINIANSGTWVDENSAVKSGLSRTFVVVTTGKQSKSAVYTYETNGKLRDLTKEITLPPVK